MFKAQMYRKAMIILFTLGVAAALEWSGYRYGMFFNEDFYWMEAIIYMGLIGWVVLLAATKRIDSIPLAALLPLGMSVLYMLELWLGPASTKGTIDSMLRWLTYGSWSILLWGLWRSDLGRAWGRWAIQSTGVLLLAGGWAGWYGWTTFPQIVLRFNDAELSATGARLAGFMQYPNAYGAVLAAFLLMQLQSWTDNSKPRAYSWLASITVIPYGAALFLTESRGAIVALLFGILLAYFLHKPYERRRFRNIFGITAVGSAIMAKFSWNWMQGMDGSLDGVGRGVVGSVHFWIALFSAIVGAIILIRLRKDRLSRKSGINEEIGEFRKVVEVRTVMDSPIGAKLSWLSAGVGVAAISWLAFGSAGSRIAEHYGTVTSRRLFYEDAWRMFKDSPIFGYGGESWRMLFGLYQSQPYVGNEVHSGYFEMMLDLGIVGVGMLLLLLGVYVIKMWKQEKNAIAPAAVLVVHAAVDFDWSYSFVWLLLIAWFTIHSVPRAGEGSSKASPASGGGWRPIGRIALALLLLCSAGAGLWTASRLDAAVSARAAAVSAAAPAAREAKLRAALDANPAWTRIRMELAMLLPLQERASLLEAGLRYEPQAPPLFLQLGITYAELGHVAQARDRLREALRLERFSRDGQTTAIVSMANLAKSLHDDGDEVQAGEAAEATVSMFERYRALDREVTEMKNVANDKKFGMTMAAKLRTAECLLLLSRDEDAGVLLLEIMTEGDEDWQEQAYKLLQDNKLL
ncbi:O-antigen ligase family protein [Cohnella abietis]|uniref:O-antigen ligase-related domain-containing protein n=1 Tax=Cohnella abietis TaxID=2507935 RepID=A0A3T1DB11_9BACL|nr:O-antigen ligase family protein [Cohnella abietis]BBI35280.1 hypothetical protein KCTCHS21_46790 [Cohnella abietis]